MKNRKALLKQGYNLLSEIKQAIDEIATQANTGDGSQSAAHSNGTKN